MFETGYVLYKKDCFLQVWSNKFDNIHK